MSSAAKVEDGWVRIPFDGGDTDRCHMAIGNPDVASDDAWRPAYKATVPGMGRVLQIRVPAGVRGHVVVWSRINGYVERVAVVRA